jgi:hypothetical protein
VVIGAVEHADVRLVLKPLRRGGGRCVEAGGNLSCPAESNTRRQDKVDDQSP